MVSAAGARQEPDSTTGCVALDRAEARQPGGALPAATVSSSPLADWGPRTGDARSPMSPSVLARLGRCRGLGRVRAGCVYSLSCWSSGSRWRPGRRLASPCLVNCALIHLWDSDQEVDAPELPRPTSAGRPARGGRRSHPTSRRPPAASTEPVNLRGQRTSFRPQDMGPELPVAGAPWRQGSFDTPATTKGSWRPTDRVALAGLSPGPGGGRSRRPRPGRPPPVWRGCWRHGR
jgi:hypothetical protein